MKKWLVGGIFLAAACGGSPQGSHRPELRAALDEAGLSLRESINVAVLGTSAQRAFQARLMPANLAMFAVGAMQEEAAHDVRVDAATRSVVSNALSAETPSFCPDAISLTDALAIAEAQAAGDGIAIVPDDDVACAFEIQILSGDTLWEVKVGGDGAVLETELSDEYGNAGTEDDDD